MGQSCLLRRNFQCSPACSYGVMRNLHGINWRGKGALLPVAAPCLGKESSSGVTPMPITIGAPAEYRDTVYAFNLTLGYSLATLTAPIKRVQLLLQSQNAMIKSSRLSHPYNGIINCFSRTIRNEGFFALWKGNVARLLGVHYHKLFIRFEGSEEGLRTGILDVTKLDFAILAISLFVHPFIYVETRLANDVISSTTGQRQFSKATDVCSRTWMTDGISQIALVTHTIIHLGVLPATRPQSISYQSNFLPGVSVKTYFDGLVAAMAVYPMYTVSKRMMMSSGEGETAIYKNTSDAFSQILKKEGVVSFYRGGGAEILRFTVVHCLMRAVFCLLSRAAGEKRNETRNPAASNAIKLTWSTGSSAK